MGFQRVDIVLQGVTPCYMMIHGVDIVLQAVTQCYSVTRC